MKALSLKSKLKKCQFEKVHAKSAAVRSNGQEIYVYAPDQSISPLAIAMALPLPETKINVVLDEPDSLDDLITRTYSTFTSEEIVPIQQVSENLWIALPS